MAFHYIPALALTLNEDILFFLVFGVFALIKYLAARKENKSKKPPEPVSDSEQARRTREIQEEIRRRIATNQKTASPATAPASSLKPRQTEITPMHTEVTPKPGVSASRAHLKEEAALGASGPDLLAQLAAAERLENETRGKAAAMRARYGKAILGSSTPAPSVRLGHVEGILHNPTSVRDVIILSEILSAPVSVREEGSCPGLR
jgi:hypothetical protein